MIRWVLIFVLAGVLAPAASLDQVMAAMDKSAAAFRDMSAKLTRVDYTAVISDMLGKKIRISFDGPRYAFDLRFRGRFPVFDCPVRR